MTDPVERLIAAWVAWERNPSSHDACCERVAAIKAAGSRYRTAQTHIATARSRGMSIPDAIQTLLNDTHQEAA